MAEKYFLHIPTWQSGTEGMPLDLEAFYLRLVNLMYLYDGVLVDNDDLISHKVFLSKRKYKTLKNQLLDMRKIYIDNGLIQNVKVLKEIDYINEKSAKNSCSAKIKHAKHKLKQSEKHTKSLKNNNPISANAEQPQSEGMCVSSAIQENRGTGEIKDTNKLVSKNSPEKKPSKSKSKQRGQTLANEIKDLSVMPAKYRDYIGEWNARDGEPLQDIERVWLDFVGYWTTQSPEPTRLGFLATWQQNVRKVCEWQANDRQRKTHKNGNGRVSRIDAGRETAAELATEMEEQAAFNRHRESGPIV